MDTALALALGIGLSAACGFRVFLPFLVMSAADLGGYLDLSSDFAWIGSYPALVAFGAATLVEVLGYCIPWVDNALDAVATPLAVIAGVLASASVLGDASPGVRWALAAISGGGAAGLVQAGTVAARATSSATTGGLGNFLVATGEAAASLGTSVLAIAVPVAAVALVVVFGVVVARRLRRRRELRNAEARGKL